jgi:hypothetical protein
VPALRTDDEDKGMKPTKQQWEEVKQNLSGVYGNAYFRCDGYLIHAAIERSKMKLHITVYVNGWIKGTLVWHGFERDMDKMSDIARRFFCLSSKGPSAKRIARNKKIFGAKFCKEEGLNDRYYSAFPWFRTSGAFITHLKKRNQSIEVLDRDAYVWALNDMNGEVAG